MSSDVFQVERGWREHDLFVGEPYSRGEAWLWLIESACWKATKAKIKGQVVALQRGQLSFSIRFLAEKWGWDKMKVQRFLTELKAQRMIAQAPKSDTTNETTIGQG